ncbi:protein FAM173B isoform X1 [Cimex lectularius]|uniref:Protein FAM173B n=1 Tax=Cimex lectularius TaxID=79782 RepID=A0A8I6RKJ0_CIMLE|nr:protein FAM173B isoform X1 [Cimex lectularius]
MEVLEAGNTSSGNGIKRRGLFLIGITGGAAVAVSALCYPFLSPALRRICLPYVPATGVQVSNVLKALTGKSGSLLDIGSGDGRIVLATAKRGFQSDGVELNIWLVLYSKFAAFKAGLSKSTNFYRRDLWAFPIHSYRNVVIFGTEEMMADIEEKFSKELLNSNVVACRFPLPNREPIKTIGSGIDTVWLYEFKKPTDKPS